MSIETQETITFEEFRAWLAGLIRGKGGALPDLTDWKVIKSMMDKVVPETVTIPMPVQPITPAPDPYRPVEPYYIPPVWVGDPPPYTPPQITCEDSYVGMSADDSVQYILTNVVTEDEVAVDGLTAAFNLMFTAQEEN